VVAALAVILSLPALAYVVKVPSTVNALSLALTFGFFVAVVILVRRHWLLVLVSLPVLIVNAIEVFNILVYNEMISLGALQAVLYVDPHEAREYVGEHAGSFVSVLLAIAAYWSLIVARSNLDRLRTGQRAGIAVVALAVPAGLLAADLTLFGSSNDVYLPTRVVDHAVIALGANPLKHTLSGIAAVVGARADMARFSAERSGHRFGSTRIGTPPPAETYVLVIGESSRRRSWSLYGYGRPTSPRLSARQDLVAFTNAISPSVTTGLSLPHSLALVPVERREQFYTTRSLVSAFREAGFRTFWLSNQGSQRSVVGSEIALIMGEADVVETTNNGFMSANLDGVLLPLFDQAMADPAPRKLIVVHTMGSHTNYRQRVPENWSLPTPSPSVRQVHGYAGIDDGMAGIIDDYDRTISYTDWFVDQLITRLQMAGHHGALVYFSDHGQRLFDDADREKGHGFGTVKPVDVEVPLLVWLSPPFAAAHPERRSALAANATRPVSTAALAASLLDLASIRVDMPEARGSMFGSDHRPSHRLVLSLRGEVVDLDAMDIAARLAAMPGN
jgi:glucan phosphoethanolaminetransferase (alkaline phosphatase superfamily)